MLLDLYKKATEKKRIPPMQTTDKCVRRGRIPVAPHSKKSLTPSLTLSSGVEKWLQQLPHRRALAAHRMTKNAVGFKSPNKKRVLLGQVEKRVASSPPEGNRCRHTVSG
jgi:hypothetical protein